MTAPKLMAEFRLDNSGKPIFKSVGDKKHYLLNLYVSDAPPDAYSVSYGLDESYVVPKRLVPKNVPRFQECITSYGNYEVSAAIMTKDLPSSPSVISDSLSNALQRNYGRTATAEIRSAIQDILDN